MARRNLLAALLIGPVLLLVLASFLLPLLVTLYTAIANPEVREALPRTAAILRAWDGDGLPPEEAFAAIVDELAAARDNDLLGGLSRRLNFERTGLRSLLLRTLAAKDQLTPPFKPAMIERDARWGEPALWQLIRRNATPLTPVFLLRSLDLNLTPIGEVTRVDADQAIFLPLFLRTFEISVWVTVLCALLGYPVAHALCVLPRRLAGIAMIMVLIPFWTSIMVRTTAWFILLQREGPVNAFLLFAGLVDAPLTMIFTRFAVYVAMVHVLLPFAILPLYSVMKRIDPVYMRAAANLGAPPWRAFLRVYLPMSMPGVAAGALIVFMLSVGFYITPALVGGADDQMVSYFIAFFTGQTINWGMAAALASLLLIMTGALVAIGRWLLPGGASLGAARG